MMHQNLAQDLRDILRYSQYILDDTAGLDLDAYLANRVLRFAVERSLIVIGESATHLRSQNPNIFEKIDSLYLAIGVRNRLAHGYDDQISNEAMWLIVQDSIPKLIQDIEALL